MPATLFASKLQPATSCVRPRTFPSFRRSNFGSAAAFFHHHSEQCAVRRHNTHGMDHGVPSTHMRPSDLVSSAGLVDKDLQHAFDRQDLTDQLFVHLLLQPFDRGHCHVQLLLQREVVVHHFRFGAHALHDE